MEWWYGATNIEDIHCIYSLRYLITWISQTQKDQRLITFRCRDIETKLLLKFLFFQEIPNK